MNLACRVAFVDLVHPMMSRIGLVAVVLLSVAAVSAAERADPSKEDTGALNYRQQSLVGLSSETHGGEDVVARAAREGKSEGILFNLCDHGHFDMQANTDYFAGKLQDLNYDEAELAMALSGLPSVPA